MANVEESAIFERVRNAARTRCDGLFVGQRFDRIAGNAATDCKGARKAGPPNYCVNHDTLLHEGFFRTQCYACDYMKALQTDHFLFVQGTRCEAVIVRFAILSIDDSIRAQPYDNI